MGEIPTAEEIDGLYKDNFWEESTRPLGEGFSILVARLYQGKESWKELAAFMEKRAKVEEEYAKQLLALVKITVIGKDEVATTRAALDAAVQAIVDNANARLEHARWLIEDLAKPVMKLKDTQKSYRKQVEAEINKMKQDLDSLQKKARNAKDKYAKVTKEAEAADKIYDAASVNPDMTPHDVSKLNQKLLKVEKEVDAAEEEYWKAVCAVRKIQERYVERVEIAGDQFQLLDAQRIDYLRDVLAKYEVAERALIPKLEQSAAVFMSVIQNMDPYTDIREYTEQHKLNSVPRPPYRYVEIQQPRVNGVRPPRRPEEANNESVTVDDLEIHDSGSRTPQEPESPGSERVKAAYSYVPVEGECYPEEIELNEGEVIEVISRSRAEGPDWWWGRRVRDGQEGLFPSTYVTSL